MRKNALLTYDRRPMVAISSEAVGIGWAVANNLALRSGVLM